MTSKPTPDRPEVDDPRVLALATARQHIAYSSPLNFVCPPWDGLTEQEQHLSLLDARNYLHAAITAGLAPAVSAAAPPTTRTAESSSVVGQATRDRIAEILRPHASLGGTAPRYEVPLFDGATPSLPRISGWRPLDEVVDALAVLLLPPPAARAAALREAADGFDRHAEQILDGVGDKAVFVAKALRDQAAVWREAAETMRRMADEAQQSAVGAQASADLIEDYLRFLRGQGPEPDLSDLPSEQREAVAGQFEIVKALADRDPELPPLDRDPVALRLGLLDAAPAAECSAQHRNFDDGRLCIRAAQHRGDHIDERGFHWSDTVAVYPVGGGTFRSGVRPSAVGARQPDTQTRDGRCPACGHTVCDGDGPCGALSGSDFCTCPGPTAVSSAVPGRSTATSTHEETRPETVHGCPPDGSGLTPCCGRTPFELPLGDRISSEAPITCRGPQ